MLFLSKTKFILINSEFYNRKITWLIKDFEQLQLEELYQILALRSAVFVCEQNSAYLDPDGFDQKSLHILGIVEGQIIAYCRIFDKDIKYPEASIGRVVLTKEYRGLDIGKNLITIALQCIEKRFENPKTTISAQNYLLSFYESFGFETKGESYLEDGIPHTKMTRQKTTASLL